MRCSRSSLAVRKAFLNLAIVLAGLTSLDAQQERAQFPKMGVEYAFALPVGQAVGLEGGALIDAFGRGIMFLSAHGGAWYQAVYVVNVGTKESPKIDYRETHVNIDHLLSLTEKMPKEWSMNSVRVEGAVNDPGIRFFSEGVKISVLEAIRQSGGLNGIAHSSIIRVKRHRKKSADSIKRDRLSDLSSVFLAPGDTLIVPQRIFD